MPVYNQYRQYTDIQGCISVLFGDDMTDKQKIVYDLLISIRPDISIVFSTRKTWHRYATCWPVHKKIVFYPLIFNYSTEACLHNALHELAHIIHYETTGKFGHTEKFKEILDKLITDYGTPEVKRAKLNTALGTSIYRGGQL